MNKKLQRKRILSSIAALFCLMPLTVLAGVVNNTTGIEKLTKTSTVYVGEVVVDGETKIKYLYSGDITINNIVITNLLTYLGGMADSDYATMLKGHEFDYTIQPQLKGFALCPNPEIATAMDENWSSAQYVGKLYFPDKPVASEINTNLYDIDEDFKALFDSLFEERKVYVDILAETGRSFVSYVDANANSSVYYTVEDGEIIKHVDTTVTFDTEATTIIYTKVELGTSSVNFDLGDVNHDGDVNVTDAMIVVDYILNDTDPSFIDDEYLDYDIDHNGVINVTDVMLIVEKILNEPSFAPARGLYP